MPKPNFFIVGAPKCGTTALDHYLGQHPDICMAYEKELHYFSTDFNNATTTKKDDYLAYFFMCKNVKRVGESSVWYLYSKQAAARLSAYEPDADIIIMLRNPVDMLFSLYYQARFDGTENLPSFEQALAAEAERKIGYNIPEATKHFPQRLFYREIIKFGEQVNRYFEHFGKDHIYIIIYDDFRQNTALVYKNTLSFLGVDTEFTTDLSPVNTNKVPRSKVITQITNTSLYRAIVPHIKRFMINTPFYTLLSKFSLHRLNKVYKPRPQLDPNLRAELQIEFRPEVEHLETVIKRDLSFWYDS